MSGTVNVNIKIVNLKTPEETSKFRAIIKDYTIESLLKTDINSIDIISKYKPLVQLLQDRCRLINRLPIDRLRRKPHLLHWILPKDELIYQQICTKDHEGFFIALDKSANKSKKNGLKSKENVKFVESFLNKYGQIRPFPSSFSWKFPWSNSSEGLILILRNTNQENRFSFLLNVHRREILDHLVAEFYIYFRRSIPPRYLDQVLLKFVNEFPSLKDESLSGFQELREAVQSSFRSFLTDYKPIPKKRILKEVNEMDKGQLLELIKQKNLLDKGTLFKLMDESQKVPRSTQDVRWTEYVSSLHTFFYNYRSKKKTLFKRLCRNLRDLDNTEIKSLNLQQISLMMIAYETQPKFLFVESDEVSDTDRFYIQFCNGMKFDDLKFGTSEVRGSVKIGIDTLFADVPIDMAVYIIVAIHNVLDLDYDDKQINFFTLIQICIMKFTSTVHTSKTRKIKCQVY